MSKNISSIAFLRSEAVLHDFITDLPADAAYTLKCIGAHWGIENNLHWVLDVIFREDDRLLWNDNVVKNEAIIRRCPLNVIRSYKTRYDSNMAIKTIRKLLIGDDYEMEKILREF